MIIADTDPEFIGKKVEAVLPATVALAIDAIMIPEGGVEAVGMGALDEFAYVRIH